MPSSADDTIPPNDIDERLSVLLKRLSDAIESNPIATDPSSHSATTSAPIDRWLAPMPLSDQQTLSPFPVKALPGWLRQWVEAEAVETQTPTDTAAMLALATLAVGSARRLRVMARHGWIEPTNLYICVVLPPGNRKSSVFRHAVGPLQKYERSEAARVKSEISEAQTAIRLAEQQLRQAEQDVLRAPASEQGTAKRQLQQSSRRLHELQTQLPVVPRLLSGDVTQEALAQLLVDQGECIAVMDSEGVGPIALMLGRYSSEGARLDLFLRGHPGDSYHCDRLGREPLELQYPRITLAITCQPSVLHQLTSHREARGLGLLARILFCVPQSTVGQRASRPPVMSHEVRAAYHRNIDTVLRIPPGKHHGTHLVSLSSAADQVLERYQTRIERLLGEGRDLGHMTDWASKLCGASVRIAALLHLAEHLERPWATEIAELTMRRAIRISEHLLQHARHVFDVMQTVPASPDAYRVLRWLHSKRIAEFSKREAFNALRRSFPTVSTLVPALRLLEERGWIRPQTPLPPKGRGRPAGPVYDVHPLVYAEEQA